MSLMILLNTKVAPSISLMPFLETFSGRVVKWAYRIDPKMVLIMSLEGVYIVKQENIY